MGDNKTKLGFITNRDKLLFRFLFESKVASIEQIHETIFPDSSLRIAYRRTRLLSKSGWLKRFGFSDEDRLRQIYSITEKAYQTYVHEEGENDRRVQLKSEVPAHDLVLADLRCRLESIPQIKRVFTENIMQSSYELATSDDFRDFVSLRTDAVAELMVNENFRYLIPIEYEASLKSKERCTKKLLDYYIKCDADNVLFVCRSKSIFNRMVDTDSEISREYKAKAYFALSEDVLDKTKKLTFTSSKGDREITL